MNEFDFRAIGHVAYLVEKDGKIIYGEVNKRKKVRRQWLSPLFYR